MVSSTPSHSLPNFVANCIANKLDDSDHLHWKQVELVIKSHRLHKFVVNFVILPHFLFDDDHSSRTLNLIYEEWKVQDQILLSLL